MFRAMAKSAAWGTIPLSDVRWHRVARMSASPAPCRIQCDLPPNLICENAKN